MTSRKGHHSSSRQTRHSPVGWKHWRMKRSQPPCLTGCSTAARLSGSEEQAIACKTGKQFLATKTRYRHVKRVKESEASSMLEWDILNYLKKWRTNLRATQKELCLLYYHLLFHLWYAANRLLCLFDFQMNW